MNSLSQLLKSKTGRRWVALDWLVGCCSLLIGLYASPYVDVYEPANRFLVAAIYGALLVVTLRLCGLNTHRMEHLISKYEIIIGSIQGTLLAFFVVGILINFSHNHVFGRYVVCITLLSSSLTIILSRIFSIWHFKKNPIKIVFLGCNELSHSLGELIKESDHFNIVCVASNDSEALDGYAEDHPCYTITSAKGFIDHLKANKPDIAISLYRHSMPKTIQTIIRDLPFSGIDVLNKGAFIELFFKEVSLNFRNLHWHTGDFFIPDRGTIAMLKRIVDIFVASIASLILLPLVPLLVFLIKLDSPGPAIFKQTRVGLMGKHFTLYKLRTMRLDAEKDGAQWATQNDPRVTRLGAILRKSRLDEVPQLWNVLKGDMSLVGPRPERPEFVDQLKEIIPLYEWRHLMPPGLTGWAQIRYKYADNFDDSKRKLQFDLYYIKNFSLRLDIEILLNTIPLMMRGSR